MKVYSYFSYSNDRFLIHPIRCFFLFVFISPSLINSIILAIILFSIMYSLHSFKAETFERIFAIKSNVICFLKYENIANKFSISAPFIYPSPNTCFCPSSFIVILLSSISLHSNEWASSLGISFISYTASSLLNSAKFFEGGFKSYLTLLFRYSKILPAQFN